MCEIGVEIGVRMRPVGPVAPHELQLDAEFFGAPTHGRRCSRRFTPARLSAQRVSSAKPQSRRNRRHGLRPLPASALARYARAAAAAFAAPWSPMRPVPRLRDAAQRPPASRRATAAGRSAGAVRAAVCLFSSADDCASRLQHDAAPIRPRLSRPPCRQCSARSPATGEVNANRRLVRHHRRRAADLLRPDRRPSRATRRSPPRRCLHPHRAV